MLSGADCFQVQCDYNDFHLSFISNLYGVEDDLVNQFEPIAMVKNQIFSASKILKIFSVLGSLLLMDKNFSRNVLDK